MLTSVVGPADACDAALQVVGKLLDSHPEFLVKSARTGEDALHQLGQLPFLPNALLLAKQLPCGNGDEVSGSQAGMLAYFLAGHWVVYLSTAISLQCSAVLVAKQLPRGQQVCVADGLVQSVERPGLE